MLYSLPTNRGGYKMGILTKIIFWMFHLTIAHITLISPRHLSFIAVLASLNVHKFNGRNDVVVFVMDSIVSY